MLLNLRLLRAVLEIRTTESIARPPGRTFNATSRVAAWALKRGSVATGVTCMSHLLDRSRSTESGFTFARDPLVQFEAVDGNLSRGNKSEPYAITAGLQNHHLDVVVD
jgi:hypothetical protein